MYQEIRRYKKQNTFDLAFESAKSMAAPLVRQQSMNGFEKSVIHKIDYVFNQVSTPP